MWGVGMLWYHLWCFCIVFSVWGVRASFCGRCLAHSICHCTVHSHGRLGVPSALWFLFWKCHLMNRCVSSESLAVGDCFFAVSWMATVGGKILVCICWFYTQVGHYTSTSSFTVVAKKKYTFPGPFGCELDCGVCLVDFSYEVVQTFLSMIPKMCHQCITTILQAKSSRSSLPIKMFV